MTTSMAVPASRMACDGRGTGAFHVDGIIRGRRAAGRPNQRGVGPKKFAKGSRIPKACVSTRNSAATSARASRPRCARMIAARTGI